jgi:type I restriction enzyme, S subunit
VITLQERVHAAAKPEDWQLGKLHQVFRVRRGNKNTGMKEDNLLSLSYGRIIQKDIETADGLLPENFEGYQIVEPGNIVLRLTDLQNDKRSLRQGLVTRRGIITSAYDAVEVQRENDPRFWFYSLLALDLAKHYYSLGGGVRQSVKFADFPNDWVYRPDLETQRQIAEFLDRETARIDLLIEKKQRLVALLGEKLSSVTERLVAFGPDAAWEKVETGNTWLPVVAKGVELLPIKRVARLVNGYAFSGDELGEEGVPVIRIGDVGSSIDTESAKKFTGVPSRNLNQFVVQRGDILIAMTGATIGKYGVYESDVRAYLNQRVGILRANEIDRKFLSNCLGTRTFVEQMKLFAYGGAQPNIGAGEIGSILIPVPPRETQNLVADLVEVQKRSFTSISTAVHGSIDRLKEYRSALISAAVTGQVDVSTWGKQGKTDRHLEQLEAEASE